MPEQSTKLGQAVKGYILRAYRDFCAFHHFTPVLPCAWTWEQAVAYRQGQRTRDGLDKAARLADRYISGQVLVPVPAPSNEAIYERLLELERDISGLNAHRHQPRIQSGAETRLQSKRRIES